MGMVAVASAKGSPGVTTAALLFAALWPRPSVMVECDPSGGDVALRMPGIDGEPLDPNPGLLNLVAAGRKSLYPELVSQHVEQIVGGLDVVTGMTAPEQASGLGQCHSRPSDRHQQAMPVGFNGNRLCDFRRT